jgi:hypothetical protein
MHGHQLNLLVLVSAPVASRALCTVVVFGWAFGFDYLWSPAFLRLRRVHRAATTVVVSFFLCYTHLR